MLRATYVFMFAGLIAMALPRWLTHQVDAETQQSIKACLMGVVLFPIVIPWSYVLANYVKKPGDRWTAGRFWSAQQAGEVGR